MKTRPLQILKRILQKQNVDTSFLWKVLQTIFSCTVAQMFILPIAQVWCVERPQWEIGGGVASGITPHYLGSNHYYKLTAPFPYVVYRRDTLSLGSQGKLLLFQNSSASLVIDIELSGRLPVESDRAKANAPSGADDPDAEIYQNKNYTRRGMPDLPVVGMAGLQLKWRPLDWILMGFPVFHGITFGNGFSVDEDGFSFRGNMLSYMGNTFSPYLDVRPFRNTTTEENGLSLGVNWLYGNRRYNHFYYGVYAKESLEDRPSYQASSGLTAVTYSAIVYGYPAVRWILGAGYFHHDMRSSAVKDSPLVIATQSRTLGIFVTYVFLKSHRMVTVW